MKFLYGATFTAATAAAAAAGGAGVAEPLGGGGGGGGAGGGGGGDGVGVTVTPWCDNSMRVRISLFDMPPSTAAATAALAKTLADKGMTDLAAALDDRGPGHAKCTPGEPVVLGGQRFTHGNLQVVLGGADGSTLTFARADTGAALFSATPSFAANAAPPPPPTPSPAAAWGAPVADKDLLCTANEHVVDLGAASSAEACLGAARALGDRANYAIWRADEPSKPCSACTVTGRGPPSNWTYVRRPGATSWVGPSLPSWMERPNMGYTCSGSEFVGSAGSFDSAAGCLAAVIGGGEERRANYAIWSHTHGCFLCNILTDPAAKLHPANSTVFYSGRAVPTGMAGASGYLTANLTVVAGAKDEVAYGLGQGNWTQEGGCPTGPQRVVPLERNGQTVNLQQRKFHVSIPFLYSSAGYGFLFNMPGYGSVTVGSHGEGGAAWSASAALYLDFWVTGLPAAVAAPAAGPVYAQYADATGHAPPLREDAMIFWQSRNRYKSTAIALSVAERYAALDLPVGVLVIDYKNQKHDGDFAPDPSCFPSVRALSDGVRKAINATTVFSFWPEVLPSSPEFPVLRDKGCLINADLSGLAVDATIPECRDFIWSTMLKPRYYDQGVSAYWLDETDGEGTGGGDGDYGYNTSYGPPAAYSNMWVNDWLGMYTDPVAALGEQYPLALTRGVWAGGQRKGVVLWSSDILSTFEQLASQVPQGVHASLSGIPWWTTDVGGYGCGNNGGPTDQPYMQELIVRWYQFGCFSPVFRTHGCRAGPSEPDAGTCKPAAGSCGFNEAWSYGNATQPLLEKYIRLRATMKPYIAALDANVTARGVLTMRPLAFEFPADKGCRGIDDQYLLGPELLVAPVTTQGATNRSVYFPKGATWENFFNTEERIAGGQRLTVAAPLDIIPVYKRV